jgi:hypothetical protein
MKYLKKYQKFFEDGEGGGGGGVAYSNASNTAGPGNIVAAQVGPLPGVPGPSGSGDDVANVLGAPQTKAPIDSFNGKKKSKKKKGKPSEVSDLRDLDESLGWEKPSDESNQFDLATECVELYHWLCEDGVDKEQLNKDIKEITNDEGWYSLDDETLNRLVDLLKNYNK